MNQQRYRILFNKARGQLMAVSETATSQGKDSARGETPGASPSMTGFFARLPLMKFALYSLFGLVTVLPFSLPAQAQISADPNAPRNQQPTILPAGNGVPVVNIQTPSAAGVSRNTYQQFDVNGNGAILNNSRTNVQTQQGGWVQGNPWLANGSARVILNEVNSSNPSQLRGYVEVAGQRAQVIIANPAGITCDGCGFINANQATLTTGIPIFNNGNLESYRVTGGNIVINGRGLDATQTDYTQLIARAVQVNAGVWANQLTVVAGVNDVSATDAAPDNSHGITPIASDANKPTYAIDVAQLGGMYAGKITLIGTEAGVGVRNAGNIGASAGEVVVTADGRLQNSGAITSTGSQQLTSQNGLSNSGTLYSAQNQTLNVRGALENTGIIGAAQDLTLTATRSAAGEPGQITQTSTGTLAAGLQPDFTTSTAGNLHLTASDSINVAGQLIAGQSQTLQTPNIQLAGSTIQVRDFALAAQNINLDRVTLNTAGQTTLTATNELSTQSAHISAQKLNLTAQSLNNSGGELIQVGTDSFNLNLAGELNNTFGRIASNGTGTFNANTLNNSGGNISMAGALTIQTQNLNNQSGQIQTNDALQLSVTQQIDNRAGTLSTQQSMGLQAGSLTNAQTGQILNSGTGALSLNVTGAFDNQAGTVAGNGAGTLNAQTLNNHAGEISLSGPLTLQTNQLSNSTGLIESTQDALQLNVAQSLDNSAGTLASHGALNLRAASLNNTDGLIAQSSVHDLSIDVSGAFDNTRGTLSSTSDQARLIAGSLNNTNGYIGVDGALTLNAATLSNQRGVLTAGDTLALTATQGLNNQDGFIGANHAFDLTTTTLDNTRGQISAILDALTIHSTDTHNQLGDISAGTTLALTSTTLDNTQGQLSAQTLQINTQNQVFTNTAGRLIADGDIQLNSGALDNTSGLIQAGGALTLDTHGQTLTNSASGNTAGILAVGDMHLSSATLNNQTGFIGANGELTVQASTVNNGAGAISAGQNLAVTAEQINNASNGQTGQLQATQDITLQASSINNDASLIWAGQALNIQADSLSNAQTYSVSNPNMGLQANDITLAISTLDNTTGAIRADHSLTLTSSGTLSNTSGLIQAVESARIADQATTKTLAITNESGTFLTGSALTLDTATYTGTGTLASYGDLTLSMQGDATHTGTIQGYGNVSVSTTGTLTNQNLIEAGGVLNINAQNINNTVTGEFNGAINHLTTPGTLTNRGLIDGGLTWLETGTLTNIGTGRIYGNLIAIQTGQLTNDAETLIGQNTNQNNGQPQAAVIAAREDLQIGASNILNRSHSLIFSLGTMSMGSTLDANGQATGQAQSLTNHSATIESLGNMDLSIAQIDNLNDNFQTGTREVSIEHIVEYNPFYNQPGRTDERYSAADGSYIGMVNNRPNVYAYDANGNLVERSTEFDAWDYTRTVTESYVTSTDPSVIRAGGNLHLTINDLNNTQSQVLVGGTLTGNASRIRNNAGAGQRITTRSGGYVAYRNGGSSPDAYNPAPTVIATDLGAAIKPGDSNYADPGSQSGDPAGTRTEATVNSTLSDTGNGTITRTGTGSATGSHPAAIAPITEVPAQGSGVIRTTIPSLTFPDNSLFHLHNNLSGQPGVAGNYLIETDPRFTNNKTWLSSDFMLQALNYDPALIQKRLGDGFYEQKLIREQVAHLTGMRFLDGHSNDEEQYLALLNNGATFAQQYGLIPGVSLSAEQMALLTSDIVWLVEQTITLPDGTTTRALVPQVYAKVQPGDINGSGSLIAARDIQLKLSGDLSNDGTLAARNTLSIAAANISQTGGRISANAVSLKADQDIIHTGGLIDGKNAVILNAGRDLTIASRTVNTTNAAGTSSATNIERIASVRVGNQIVAGPTPVMAATESASRALDGPTKAQVSNPDSLPNGLLILNAGRDLNLTGANVQNNVQDGLSQLKAGNDIHINTVTVSQSLKLGSGDNHTNTAASAELGSSLKTQGDLLMNAGHDLNARAAQVSAGGDLIALAGNNINITAGQNSQSLDTADHYSSSGFMSKSSVSRQMQTEDHTLTGSSFSAGGSLGMQAGNDLTVVASKVSSKADTTLMADHDIKIEEGRQIHQQNRAEQDSKSNLAKKSSDSLQGNSYSDTGLSSHISGATVRIKADNDLTIRQSNVMGTEGVSLTATNGNVLVTAGQNYFEADSAEQHKSSGFNTFAGQGGFGVSYDKNKSNGEGHVIAVTQSDARSTIGATNGNVIVTAGKDATFIGTDVLASRQEGNLDAGHIQVKAQNITVLAGEDHVIQSSANNSQSSGIGAGIVGTPFDTVRNLQKAVQNDSATTGAMQTSGELFSSSWTSVQVAATAHNNQSHSQSQSESTTHQGSSFTSAGDTILRATGDGQKDAQGKALNGDILIEGSQISAGERLRLDAERNIAIQASTDTSTASGSSKSNGWNASLAQASFGDMARSLGGPNNSGVSTVPLSTQDAQGNGQSSSSTQNASVLIGHSVDVTSRTGDIRIAGSGIQAKENITLTAKLGQIDILSGQEAQSQTNSSNQYRAGDLGGTGYAGTIGVRDQSHFDQASATTQNTVRSQIVSSEGSITMTAKNDINARGADIDAARDITLIGRNVNLDPAQDTTQASSQDKSSQYGVTMALSGYAVQAAQAAENAGHAKENGQSDEVVALYAAQAVLAVTNAAGVGMGKPTSADTPEGTQKPTPPAGVNQTGNPGNSNGGSTVVKVTVSVGGGSSEASSHSASTTEQGTTIKAGGNVSIIATGSGTKDADGYSTDGDINARGAQISGAKVDLTAARDINLVSAQDTSSLDRQNSGSSASIGVGAGIGGAQNGLTLELAASTNKGQANGDSATNKNTHITASDTLSINSGRDTNIAGAQVAGNTMTADIGRDLNITSKQDTDNYHSKEESGGAQVSICVPPFCVGTTVSASGNYNSGKTDSTYQSVVEQSGIFAGTGGFDIKVKGNTDLTGAVIASTATDDKNRLETGTLTTRDIENHAEYSSDSTSISASYDSASSLAKNAATSLINTAAANAQGAQTGDANGTTKSAISGGTIVITNNDAQKEKTGQTAEETIASLNRDTTSANGSIDKIFDEQKIKDEKALADLRAQTLQQAAPILYNQVGNLLVGQNEAVKTAVHALIGGLVSQAMGGEFGSGAAGVAAGHLAVLALDSQLEGLGMSKDNRDALLMSVSTVVAGAVGAASGGEISQGMAAGSTSGLATEYNYLKHKEIEELSKAKRECSGGSAQACSKQKELETLSKQRDDQLAACSGVDSAVCNQARQDVRSAYAEILRKTGTAEFDTTYQQESLHTGNEAENTLSGWKGGAGVVVGIANSLLVDPAKLLGSLYENKMLSEAADRGDAEAEARLKQKGQEFVNTIQALSNPEVWNQMPQKLRDSLANAYEAGDAYALGKLNGEIFGFLATLPATGGAAGTIKVVKTGETVADAAKTLTTAEKVAVNTEKVAQEAADAGKGTQGLIGKDFEAYLQQTLGGKSSFSLRGREFDGAYGTNNSIWYEAKSGQYWESQVQADSKGFAKFKSDVGDHASIAKANGASFEVHSNTPIPQHVKDWLDGKGIPYKEY